MKPTDNPGYLLHHLSFVLDRQSDALLQERFGFGFSQFKILMALKWHEGVQQKQIAERLGQTEASISRQIQFMKQDGLLESKVSPKSKRERITTLTRIGNNVAEQAMQLLNDYHAPMFDRLSPHLQQELKEVLQTMHQHTCQAGKIGACHSLQNT